MFKTKAHIIDKMGTIYAEAEVSYLKLPIEKIAKDIDMHEEMPYLIEDGISEIDYDFKL